jgi:RNA polymerase sigma-70 factor (ECF subfamily)
VTPRHHVPQIRGVSLKPSERSVDANGVTRAAAVDSSLIKRARRGDQRALGQIWLAYHAPVLRYLRSLGTTDPDDVASDVWESVARSLRRFEGDADDLRRWLFTIARRRRIDHLRRTGRCREDAADWVPEALAPDDHVAKEGWAEATDLLRRLHPARAEVVALRVLGGFSVAETAQITDRTPGAVRVMTHRALAELREQLTSTDAAPIGA